MSSVIIPPAATTEIPIPAPGLANPTLTAHQCTTHNTSAPTTTPNTNPDTTTTPNTTSDPITPAETVPTSPLVKVTPIVNPVPITTTADRHTTTTTTMGHKTRKGILYTTAFLFPPLAVYFKRGTHKDFGLNILLTILGWYVQSLSKSKSGVASCFALRMKCS